MSVNGNSGTMRPCWGLVFRPEVKSVTELKGKSMGVPGLLGSQRGERARGEHS